MAIGNLIINIQVNNNQANLALQQTNNYVSQFGRNFQGVSTRMIAAGSALGISFAYLQRQLTWMVVGGTYNFFREAVNEAIKLDNAIISLSLTARAYGVDVDKAKAATKGLTDDGLLTMADAAKSVRALLATGDIGLENTIKLLNGMKDSASFAREAHLGFGEAIVNAAQGIKNSRSVKVDDVGLTKNLSVIMREYGFQLQDIDDVNKRVAASNALVTGALKALSEQAGGAAIFLTTFAGATAAVGNAYRTMQAEVGRNITTNASLALGLRQLAEWFRQLTVYLQTSEKGMYLVSDAAVLIVKGFSLAVRAVGNLMISMNQLDTVVRGVLRGIVIGINETAKLLYGVLQVAIATHPVGASAAMILMKDELIALVNVQTLASKAAESLKGDILENSRAIKWWEENTLKGTTALDGLAKGMENLRGKRVNMGDLFGEGGPTKDGAGAPAKGKMSEWLKQFKDDLAELEAKIALAIKTGTPLVELVELFGEQAQKSGKLAKVWGQETTAALRNIAAAFERAQFAEELGAISEELANLNVRFEKLDDNYWLKDFQNTTGKVTEGITNLKTALNNLFLGPKPEGFKDVTGTFRQAFEDMGAELGPAIANALASNKNPWAAAGAAMGKVFGDAYADAVKNAKEQNIDLGAEGKALGLAALGIQSLFAGYASAAAGGGAIMSSLTGALAGAPFGPVGVGIGAGAGLLGGLFGDKQFAENERRNLELAKRALADQYGGMAALRDIAKDVGWQMDQAFKQNSLDGFNDAISDLNSKLAESERQAKGLEKAIEGVNKRAALFGQQFAGLGAVEGDEAKTAANAAKMAEIAQRTQPEFERLGVMIQDVFVGLIRESQDGYAAVMALAPAFKVLEDGVSTFGLTSTAAIDELLKSSRLISDEVFGPLMANVQATGQVLSGLFTAKALSAEGFQAMAADIGQSLEEIRLKGGDMAVALALSQPVLQKLWEAQQLYGAVTDDTTAAILKQAEEQGLVGAGMKQTNEKILDVLVAIAKVLKADLPAAFAGLKAPAETAAQDIEDAFKDVKIDELKIKYRYEPQNSLPDGGGGGSDAAAAAASTDTGAEGTTVVANTYLDGELIATATAKAMPGVLQARGVVA